jgi:hypothetical protein
MMVRLIASASADCLTQRAHKLVRQVATDRTRNHKRTAIAIRATRELLEQPRPPICWPRGLEIGMTFDSVLPGTVGQRAGQTQRRDAWL